MYKMSIMPCYEATIDNFNSLFDQMVNGAEFKIVIVEKPLRNRELCISYVAPGELFIMTSNKITGNNKYGLLKLGERTKKEVFNKYLELVKDNN